MSVRNILDGTIKVDRGEMEVPDPLHAGTVTATTLTSETINGGTMKMTNSITTGSAIVQGRLLTQSLTLNNEAALVTDIKAADQDFIVTITGSSEKLPFKGYLAFYHILPKLRAIILQMTIPSITFSSFYIQTTYKSAELEGIDTAVIKADEGYYPVAIVIDAKSGSLGITVSLLNSQEKVTLTNAILKINTIFY